MAEEWSTVQVANLPLETSRPELEQLFSDMGPIKKCFVLKPRDGKKSNLGFVTFAMSGDCKAALARDDLEMGGNSLKLTLKPDKKVWNAERPIVGGVQTASSIAKNKARLIIRNLSFKAEDSSLRQYFAQHGEVVDVNILKKPDGRMVGCAFVEFKKVIEATKALKKLNASQFLGRTIAVDWAVPKEVFNNKNVETKMETKNEEEVKDEDEVKDEEIKEEPEEEDDGENERITAWKKEEDEEDDEDSEDDSDVQGEDDENDEEINVKEEKKPHNLEVGHDVNEGKTVFIRNLSYDSEESDLKALMEEYFGKVIFAKLVMDKEMGHPRGTAFVKFRRKEDAAKCIHEASPEGDHGIFLDNRRLGVLMAQGKAEVEEKQKLREQESKATKDSRNLYLAREGMIREGTQAAEGVSATDMSMRKQVEKQKKNMLKNLNMFVSSTRLCVRNLPDYVDDSKLRTMFAKNLPKSAKITECKVMRDMTSGVGGKALSKHYGFVSLSQHEDTLTALRNVNNNPTIFTNDRRPIVEFSIENRKALLARQKRLEKSREKNPNMKGEQKKTSQANQSKKLSVKVVKSVAEGQVEKNEFSGMTADPKQKGLPTHSGAKVRTDRKGTKISRKDLRKRDEERKNPKLRQKRKLADNAKENFEVATAPPDAKKAKKEKRKNKKLSKEALKEQESEKKFSSMISQYKSTLANNTEIRKKWFE